MIRTLLALSIAAAFLAAPATRAADKAAKPAAARVVAVAITDDGVKPDQIPAKAGEALQLAITRKTDKTCITHIVQQDLGVDKELPLNKTVTVDLTPKAAGKVKFVCGMGMDVATVVVTN